MKNISDLLNDPRQLYAWHLATPKANLKELELEIPKTIEYQKCSMVDYIQSKKPFDKQEEFINILVNYQNKLNVIKAKGRLA